MKKDIFLNNTIDRKKKNKKKGKSYISNYKTCSILLKFYIIFNIMIKEIKI